MTLFTQAHQTQRISGGGFTPTGIPATFLPVGEIKNRARWQADPVERKDERTMDGQEHCLQMRRAERKRERWREAFAVQPRRYQHVPRQIGWQLQRRFPGAIYERSVGRDALIRAAEACGLSFPSFFVDQNFGATTLHGSTTPALCIEPRAWNFDADLLTDAVRFGRLAGLETHVESFGSYDPETCFRICWTLPDPERN